ncbi:hypothetical protein DFR70_13310 [Nocardia tenerifensis]|uniref:Uncharacterized protein n=2 Tax=Nocardia tenerifensis TaxID=228006 RepID=A0A318JJY5_9NOCA|nr:hypothetical protein [Nocardia tenerifensis]PXX52278.1 hypothetical protein DFR70_13310 [Nocardia tenerifensis]
MDRFERESIIDMLSRALTVVQGQDAAQTQALRAAIAIWQDDECETRRKEGAEVEVGVEIEDTHPHDYVVLPPALTGLESPRQFYQRFEPRTRHIRELLPRDWASLYLLLSALSRFGHDQPAEDSDATLYTTMLDLLAGSDLFRQREKLTMYYQDLMARKGDYIRDEAGAG